LRSSSADPARSSAPWRRERADGSVTLEIHCQPGAKRTEVVGLHGDCLKVRLVAPPVEGRANTALIAFIADQFGVPQRAVTIVRGEMARRKTVHIAAPAQRPDREWGFLGQA
jgi:uncharacterized protein (TIGR00251 family)